MSVEDEIQKICEQLVADNGDDAAMSTLARRLRDLQHQLVEDARRKVQILPLLDTAPRRKKAE